MFTQGEWKAVKNPADWVIQVGDDYDIVADVYSCFTGIAEANANLIAASPKMYQALKDIHKRLSEIDAAGQIAFAGLNVMLSESFNALLSAEGKEK